MTPRGCLGRCGFGRLRLRGGLATAGLRVVDVSNPAQPREVGFYDTPGSAQGVAVSGAYAYVADDGAGLRVVDVSNPAQPREVGFYDTPGWAEGVAVSGAYAYVADYGAGLRVVDVSNPAQPREVGFYDTPGYAEGVAVSGSYAYVADGYYGGLRVVDVSNPAQPREVGFYDTPGDALGVAVSGSYAYVADAWSGLRVVDVSNPAQPREVGFYDTPGYAYGVAVSGAYAYVADGDGGLVILRFTGAGTYSISGRVTDSSGNPISGVTISDNAGHTTTTGSDGRYTLSGLAAGTYTITPSKSGYAFSPASRQVTVPPDATGWISRAMRSPTPSTCPWSCAPAEAPYPSCPGPLGGQAGVGRKTHPRQMRKEFHRR